MPKQLVMGNEAVIYGALLGGATHFFGYPITPASEIAHAAALYFPRSGRFFLQAESEISAINMIYGAAAAGGRAMTASSGPGMSLMAEGLSYLAGAELPCVIVDVQRSGPGLGYINPEQSDYNFVVKGGGHGNFHNIVYAPNSVQEMCDFTWRAFAVADKYRATVVILSDAYIGQMMEPLQLPAEIGKGERKSWAIYADRESRHNLITSIYTLPGDLTNLNIRLQEKYKLAEEELAESEETLTDDAEILLVAFGISARIAISAVRQLRSSGYRAGLFRPKTLFPFPSRRLEAVAAGAKKIAVVELNNGQMAADVELAVRSRIPVLRYNWYGGFVPTAEMVAEKVVQDMKTEVRGQKSAVRS